MLNHTTTFAAHHTPASRIGPVWNAALTAATPVPVARPAQSPTDKEMRAAGFRESTDYGYWRHPKHPGVEICNLWDVVAIFIGDVLCDGVDQIEYLKFYGLVGRGAA